VDDDTIAEGNVVDHPIGRFVRRAHPNINARRIP
jgi:hypothetical protein